jgi:hypothetical protein
MSRPRQIIPPYLYSPKEIESSLGMESRTMETLLKLGLAPQSSEGGGRGRSRLFGATGLSQVAIFSGLFWSGLEIVAAGRLSRAIFNSFYEIYGYPPSGLYQNDRKWADEIEKLRTHPDWVPIANNEWTDDSIIYVAARRSGSYVPGEAWKDDLHCWLFDRQFGFTGIPGGLPIANSLCGRTDPMQPTFRVLNWTRGGDVTARQIYEEFPFGWDGPDSPARAQARAIEEEFFRAFDSPRGRLSLNVSRTIRAAHDAIYQLRNGRSAPDTS